MSQLVNRLPCEAWYIIPRFCRFCSLWEDGILSRISSENVASWEYWFSIYPLFGKRGILENSTPKMPRFLNLSLEYCFSRYSCSSGKTAKPGYNDKTPPFSSGSLVKMQSSDLKTVLGTLRFARVPRTVLRSLDCIFPRIPRKKVESWPKSHTLKKLVDKATKHIRLEGMKVVKIWLSILLPRTISIFWPCRKPLP